MIFWYRVLAWFHIVPSCMNASETPQYYELFCTGARLCLYSQTSFNNAQTKQSIVLLLPLKKSWCHNHKQRIQVNQIYSDRFAFLTRTEINNYMLLLSRIWLFKNMIRIFLKLFYTSSARWDFQEIFLKCYDHISIRIVRYLFIDILLYYDKESEKVYQFKFSTTSIKKWLWGK